MSTLTIPIRGMHCKSCEILIEKNLKHIPGVERVEANLKRAHATVTYKGERPTDDELLAAVQAAGYEIGSVEKLAWISRDPADYFRLVIAGAILLVLYFIGKSTGIFNFNINSLSAGVWVTALVGLVAGFSTCMALIGGLVLAISARHSELHPEASMLQKFRPHIFFNLGRIIGFSILGGVIGLIGSAFQLSGSVLGALTIVVGVVMVFIGLKLVEIFPVLKYKTFTLPKSISTMFGLKKETKEYSHRGAFTLGAITFFLPCGFTQSMQLLAVATGSFQNGALVMGLFALGTAPGLLGIGGLSSIFKGQKAKIFFAIAGLAVIILGAYNIRSGSGLVSWPKIDSQRQSVSVSGINASVVPVSNEILVLKTTYTQAEGIVPRTFEARVGQKVRMEVYGQESAYGCMSTIGIPRLFNKMQLIVEGKTVVMEFTPKKKGKFLITCAMGVPHGELIVN
jgi:uncharacterized protein